MWVEISETKYRRTKLFSERLSKNGQAGLRGTIAVSNRREDFPLYSSSSMLILGHAKDFNLNFSLSSKTSKDITSVI
jgi:hypothetical protein